MISFLLGLAAGGALVLLALAAAWCAVVYCVGAASDDPERY